MSDLNTAFEAAKNASMNLSERPDNATLLKLYGLYKQGAVGDNNEPKPGFTDFVASAKWNAWSQLKGLAQDDAKQQYIDLVESLE
ncbi:MAG: acyl-CoA-binding protein [Comamonas sp.]